MRRLLASAQLTPQLEMPWSVTARLGSRSLQGHAAMPRWGTGSRRCAALYLQGWQHHEQDRHETALRAFRELLIWGRQAGHQGWIRAAESAIAATLSPETVTDTDASASVTPDVSMMAEQCRQAAQLQANGQGDAAIQVYQQVLAMATDAEQPLAIADCLNGLGLIYLDQQRYELAEARLRAATVILAEHPAPLPSAIAHHNLGVAHYQQSQYHQAQTCFQTALQHWEGTADSEGVALTLDYLGRVYAQGQSRWLALGSFAAAADVLEALAAHADVRQAAAALLTQIADLCEQTQHPDLAIAYWGEALEMYQTLPDIAPCIVIWQRLSHLHQQAGQTAIARHYFQQVMPTVG